MKPTLKDVYPTFLVLWQLRKRKNWKRRLIAMAAKRSRRFLSYRHGQGIKNMAEQSHKDIPATIYYAFKQSEVEQEGISSTGWATFLQAVIEAGYAVVGTWPLRTEKPTNGFGGFNSLSNSVVLVCRQRGQAAPSITRARNLSANSSANCRRRLRN